HDHGNCGVLRGHGLQESGPVRPREDHIQKHQVGKLLPEPGKTFLCVCGAQDLVRRLQGHLQGGADPRLVVDYQDPLLHTPRVSNGASSTRAVTAGRFTRNVVPRPCSLLTSMSPPCSWTIWCTIVRPRPVP